VEHTIAVNVILSIDCLEGLEELAATMRRRTGTSFTRSKLIRAIVTGVLTGRMDFSRCRTEVELAGLLAFVLDALGNRAPNAASARTNGSVVPPGAVSNPCAPDSMKGPTVPALALRKGAAPPSTDLGRSLSGARR
jgi:hypothetical protein